MSVIAPGDVSWNVVPAPEDNKLIAPVELTVTLPSPVAERLVAATVSGPMLPVPPVNVTVLPVMVALPDMVPVPVEPRVTVPVGPVPVTAAPRDTEVLLPMAPCSVTLVAVIGELMEIVLGLITVVACGVPAFITDVVPVSISTSVLPNVDGASVTEPVLLTKTLPVVWIVIDEAVVITGRFCMPIEPDPEVSVRFCAVRLPSAPRI